MSNSVERMSKWFYRGLWGILTKWFCVPDEPPTLPASAGEFIRAFRPSDGFLRYLKFQFWLALVVIDVAIIAAWVVVMIALLWLGVLLAPVFLFAMIAPNIVAYLAVHLRYDTTWYVISDRSMRIRRGIWIIHDITITFENVQNVTVNQGPLQRFFRIADVIVQTAPAISLSRTRRRRRRISAALECLDVDSPAMSARDPRCGEQPCRAILVARIPSDRADTLIH
jgi:membrane protein YdbS with pleckstrin-like domain